MNIIKKIEKTSNRVLLASQKELIINFFNNIHDQIDDIQTLEYLHNIVSYSQASQLIDCYQKRNIKFVQDNDTRETMLKKLVNDVLGVE